MMDLESPTPTPDPTPAPAPVEAPAPVAPVDPDEAQAVEVQGEKRVPLAALKAAREENKALKERAAKADQYEQYLVQKAPMLKVLEDNPQLFQQATQPQQAPAPTGADPELVELARSLDYYDKNGAPDLERAVKHQQIIRREAQRIAQTMVQPLAQTTAQEASNANWARLVTQKLPNGQTINADILAKYWRSVPAQYTADKRVAVTVFNQAFAEQMMTSALPNAPAPPANPPLHTENAGSLPRQSKPISPVEAMILEARGMDAKKYGELTKTFTPGRTSSLED